MNSHMFIWLKPEKIQLEQSFVLRSKLPLFPYKGDGHQPNSRGLYTHDKDSLLKV